MTSPNIWFWLNDRRVELVGISPTTTLLRYLRDQAGLVGTKEGCAEGDCGACTVAVLDDGPATDAPAWRAVNACLLFLPMLQGRRVVTVEGLRGRPDGGGTEVDGLHPAQLAVIAARGSQCGYCTPGVVMSLFEATYRADISAPSQLDDQLCGNLCRCTGYRSIRDAARVVAGTRPADRFLAEARTHRRGPAGLDVRWTGRTGDQRYIQPTGLAELLALRASHPDALLVAGATDLALRVNKAHEHLPLCLGVGAVPELSGVAELEDGWRVGAATNLTALEDEVGHAVPGLGKMLRVFGSRQIRSAATVGGNLCTASPIGDLGPALVALGATVTLARVGGARELPLDDFFVGYRRTALAADEVLVSVFVPRVPEGARYSTFKVSKRRELDISTVAAGMWVQLDAGRVARVRLAFGGLSARPAQRAARTEQALLGRPWTEEEVLAAAARLDEDYRPIDDLRGSATYRRLLARNLLLGFWLETRRRPGEPPDPEPVGTIHLGSDALGEASR